VPILSTGRSRRSYAQREAADALMDQRTVPYFRLAAARLAAFLFRQPARRARIPAALYDRR
jgi:hypothetical protein